MRFLSILTIQILGLCITIQAQTASIQFVHCSSDSALSSVDVWVDTIKIIDDLDFRSSSTRIILDTGIYYNISICPSNSNDTANNFHKDSIIFHFENHNQAFLTGFVTSGYNPFFNINLSVYETLLSAGSIDESAVTFFNAGTDVGVIDITNSTYNNQPIVSALQYSERASYSIIEAFNYIFKFSDNDDQKVIRELEVFLGDLKLGDSAFTLVITGFEDRAANFNGPSLGFHIVRNSGGLFIPVNNALSQIQIINNVADPAFSSLDFYLNNNLASDNLKFRNATGYLEVPSGRILELLAAPNNSSSVNDSLMKIETALEYGKSYVYVLNGLEDQNISPYRPIGFSGLESKKVAGTGYNCDIAWVHGATDMNGVSINETSQLGESLFSNSQYGDFEGYVSIPSANYQIELKDHTTEDVLLNYSAPLSQLGGSAQTWVLSGFIDSSFSDSTNRLGIFVATQVGGPMYELSTSTGFSEPVKNRFSISPNPAANWVQLHNVDDATSYAIYDLDGKLWMNGYSRTDEILDCSTLQSGIYYLLIKQGDYQQSERLVIVK